MADTEGRATALDTALLNELARIAAQGERLAEVLAKIERQISAPPTTPPDLGMVLNVLPNTDRPDRQGGVLSLDRQGFLRTRGRRVITQDLSSTIRSGATDSARVKFNPVAAIVQPPTVGADVADMSGPLCALDDVNRAAGEVIALRGAFEADAAAPSWIIAAGVFGATVGVTTSINTALLVFPFVFFRSSVAVAADRTFRLITTAT